MAEQTMDRRIAYVRGLEIIFEREDPDVPGGLVRKAGSRRLVGAWAAPLAEEGGFSKALIAEYHDGSFEPSSIPGVFSDFAGAAAVELTVRSLHQAHARQLSGSRRQRDIGMAALTAVAAILMALISFR